MAFKFGGLNWQPNVHKKRYVYDDAIRSRTFSAGEARGGRERSSRLYTPVQTMYARSQFFNEWLPKSVT
eukprot:scaffold107751_cov18-Prasinocladus_malaysianus.AAC.1